MLYYYLFNTWGLIILVRTQSYHGLFGVQRGCSFILPHTHTYTQSHNGEYESLRRLPWSPWQQPWVPPLP